MSIQGRWFVFAVVAILLATGCEAIDPPEDEGGPATTEASSALLLDSLLCAGDATATYDPAVTNTLQSTTIDIDVRYGLSSPGIGACVVVGAAITGGTRSSTSTLSISCTQLLGSSPVTHTYNWSNGSTSTIAFATQTINRLMSTTVIANVGTVTSGFGNGHSAIMEIIYPNLALDACFTSGVSALTGTSTITILPLL